MDRAHARLPTLSLDPKRIAATSVAIAVHVLVLMLLLMPGQTAPSKALEEQPDRPVTPDIKIKVRPLIPLEEKKPIKTTVRQPQPLPLQPPAEPVDTTPSPMDQYVPLPPADQVPTDFGNSPSTPAFVQIRADVAPPPPYPRLALTRGITGEVVLRVLVDAQGAPVSAIIERSSGSKLLDQAALKFVLARWHFVPATQDGKTIEAYALVPINFVIQQ